MGFRGRVASLVLAVVLGCTISTASMAESDEAALPSNIFSLSASAVGEAANDLMRARIVAQGEGEDAAELQSQINASMQWAMSRLRPFTTIKTKTLDYQTYPTYDRKRKNIIGWRASQSIQLETDDVKAAGDAILRLQERLQVTGIQFQPKPETRRAMEDQLINDALNAFKQRAQLIRTNIGAPGYTVLEVDVQSHDQFGHQMQRYDASVSRASEEWDAPALQGGTSQVTVTVQGRIQLGVPR